MAVHDVIITNRVNQTFHANKYRRGGKVYSPGDLVYLSTQNLSLPKGRVRKLLPKYIGLYKIIEVNEKTSNVKLELPPELAVRHIMPMFHIDSVNLAETLVQTLVTSMNSNQNYVDLPMDSVRGEGVTTILFIIVLL